MYSRSIGSGLRSSNLKLLTIADIVAAEEDETIKGARIMKSRKYKSSIFYETKSNLIN